MSHKQKVDKYKQVRKNVNICAMTQKIPRWVNDKPYNTYFIVNKFEQRNMISKVQYQIFLCIHLEIRPFQFRLTNII